MKENVASEQHHLLITGFTAYGPLRENPSAELVRWLGRQYTQDQDIAKALLPASYFAVRRRLRTLMSASRPDAILMFGYSSRAAGLRIEQLAHNRDNASGADRDGVRGQKGPIILDGPSSYQSSAPAMELYDRLARRHLPVELSSDAGGFVCNHAYFLALHHGAIHGIPKACVFVHVPRWKGTPIESGVLAGAKLLVEMLRSGGEIQAAESLSA
jgi:pyroglutamyl-peptidase